MDNDHHHEIDADPHDSVSAFFRRASFGTMNKKDGEEGFSGGEKRGT